MAKKKEKKMTRAEADELYRDLRQAMNTMKKKDVAAKAKPQASGGANAKVAKEIAAALKKTLASEPEEDYKARPKAKKTNTGPAKTLEDVMPDPFMSTKSASMPGQRGQFLAVGLVLTFALTKVVLSALAASGLAGVNEAEASLVSQNKNQAFMSENFNRQEVNILTALDERRRELEERGRKLDEKTLELNRRDREFVSKLTELRDLTSKLQTARDKEDRKRDSQLEQLSNVYGSMNPKGAAELIEQLDLTIALALLERMPEKRIGQILALMSPDRALALTRMLSGGAS